MAYAAPQHAAQNLQGPGRWFKVMPAPYFKEVKAGSKRSMTNPNLIYTWNRQNAEHWTRATDLFVPQSSVYQPALFGSEHMQARVAINPYPGHPDGGTLDIPVQSPIFRFWPPASPGQYMPVSLQAKAHQAGHQGFCEFASDATPNLDHSEWHKKPFLGNYRGVTGYFHTVMFPPFEWDVPAGAMHINGRQVFVPAQRVFYKPHHEHVFLPYTPVYGGPRDITFKTAEVRLQLVDPQHGPKFEIMHDGPPKVPGRNGPRPLQFEWWPEQVGNQEVEPKYAKLASPSNTLRIAREQQSVTPSMDEFVAAARQSNVRKMTVKPIPRSAGLTFRQRISKPDVQQRGVRLPGVNIPEDKEVIVTSQENEGYHYNPDAHRNDLDAGRRMMPEQPMRRRAPSLPTQHSRASLLNVARNRTGSSYFRDPRPHSSQSTNNLEGMDEEQRRHFGGQQDDDDDEGAARSKSR